jgi:hypothetical protein
MMSHVVFLVHRPSEDCQLLEEIAVFVRQLLWHTCVAGQYKGQALGV